MALINELNGIGDAIREKTGGTDLIPLKDMASAIANIQGGGGGNNDTRLKEFVEGTLTELVDDEITSVRSYCFNNSGIQSVDLQNCKTINATSFTSCTKLTSVNLPNCESVGQSAFNACSALESVNLPQCTTLSSDALKNCSKLTSIVLPNCATVGSDAFNNCTALERVDLGSATKINKQAFYNCKALTTLIIRTNEVASVTVTSLFYNTPIASGTGFIYVPDDLVDDYKVASGWSNWADQFKGLSELGGDS